MISIKHKRVDKGADWVDLDVNPLLGYKFITSIQLLPEEEKLRFFIENFDKISLDGLKCIVENDFPTSRDNQETVRELEEEIKELKEDLYDLSRR